jgi:hypothetical protein
MNSDMRNTEAELLSKEGRFISDGSLGEIVRIYDALPESKKRHRFVRYRGKAYEGGEVLKLLAQHQQA